MKVSIKDLENLPYQFNMKYKPNNVPQYTKFNLYVPIDHTGKCKKIPFYCPNWHAVNGHFNFYTMFDLLKDLYPLHSLTYIEAITD